MTTSDLYARHGRLSKDGVSSHLGRDCWKDEMHPSIMLRATRRMAVVTKQCLLSPIHSDFKISELHFVSVIAGFMGLSPDMIHEMQTQSEHTHSTLNPFTLW